MGVANRDFDGSEQIQVSPCRTGPLATGVTGVIYVAPYPVTVQQIKYAAQGLSGAPVHAFNTLRFVVGAGMTAIPGVGSNATIAALGTSGLQAVTLAAAGSSLLTLQAGDAISILTSGANTAVDNMTYVVVVEALQDIKSYFGTSYS